jgi:hypothetical protein
MNALRRTTIWGWMILWGLTLGQSSLLHAASSSELRLVEACPAASAESSDKEMDRFFEAKEQVFKRNWEKARRGFEAYLEDYPQGRLRDEGLYWLASTLNMLSKRERTKNNIVALKKAAIVKINELIDKHPESLWRDDGMALRIEIASQLILMGQEGYTQIIDEAVRTQGKDVRQLRILALNSLVELDDDYVRPLIQNILKTDTDREIRKRCVQLLGQNFPDGSLDLLRKLAAEDEDSEIKKEAQSWVDRINQSRIPVYMKYNIYGSRLLDDSLYDEFPEGEFRTIPLDVKGAVKTRNILDLIRPVFSGKLSSMSSSADGMMPYPGFYFGDRLIFVTNRAGDYQLWIKPDELKVTEDRISGVVEFRHRQTNKKTDVPFELNRGEAKLLTTRSGNTISLMVIQWMGEELPDTVTIHMDKSDMPEELLELADMAKNLVMKDKGSNQIVFNLMGWTVGSARENWSLDDLTGKTGKYDLGQAEAVSSDPAGWKLVGNLVLLIKEKQFIGRKATLTDPKGKKVAAGDEVIVPVENPADFQVKGARKIEAMKSDIPDYGPLEAQAVFRIKPNVEIQTDRKYFNTEEFGRNLIEFGRSRARLAEKISPSTKEKPSDPQKEYATDAENIYIRGTHATGRMWTLLGDIFWIKTQNRLIGFGALVIDPDREVKAQGLISVPLDDPAAYKVLYGKTWAKREIIEQEDESNTRHYYPCMINSAQGWQVMTTLHSDAPSRGGKRDYSLAQAELTYEGKEWILIGHIMLLEKERKFIARKAALINSEGKIVFGSEIEVPTDDPSRAKVIKKRS